jgi:DNA (cytosine-5)-methyltransferase 1
MKVATAFSGIGAIEHALERMGIENDIVFACDNSNIVWSEKCTKKVKMYDLLQLLEESGCTYPGISALSSCWNNCLTKDSRFFLQHIAPTSSFGNVDDAHELSNQTLICECCHEQLSNPLNANRKNLTGVQKEALASIAESQNRHRTGVQREAQRILSAFGKDEPITIPNLKDVLTHCISSIEEPRLRKTAVDMLYEARGKTAFVEQSYLANYDVPKGHFHKDVTFLDGTHYKDQVDLFVGGSPCQSFSFVGHQGGFDDARGTLFYDFVRLVDEIKPKMFIWENVKGVYTHDGGNTWDVITKCFDNTGYTWSHAILNSKDYGIPQHRQRVFVVGFLDGGANFAFPDPIELKLTMQDFLEDQVAGKYFLNTKGVDFVTWDKNHRKQYTQIDGEIMLCQKANQQFNWHGDFVFVEENNGQHLVDEKHFLSQKVEAYVMATGTKGFRSIPRIDLDVARPLLSTMHKNHRAGVDNYVTTEGRIRMLTPKECLRLMGFCDSFKQVVSNNQLYRQAGNSIVVDVLIAIMAQAIPVLAGQNTAFSNLQERADRIRELFDELPERQIQQSDLDRVVAALST